MKAFIVRTKPYGEKDGAPYDVREIETTTFNHDFAYYFGEVYETEELAHEAKHRHRREALESWRNPQASPYWAIGGQTTGKPYPVPEWWEQYGYTGEKVFVNGYMSGWYWKPVPIA